MSKKLLILSLFACFFGSEMHANVNRKPAPVIKVINQIPQQYQNQETGGSPEATGGSQETPVISVSVSQS